jgi:FkbM family methyltransferase
MSLRTSPAVIALRNLGRALGVNALVGRWLAGSRYEDRFQQAMLDAVREADVVWDVGANQGLYTRQFAERVGPRGRVYAFEPSPRNLVVLRAAVAALANVTVVPSALGREPGEVSFRQGDDALGATSRIVAAAEPAGGAEALTRVRVARADALVAEAGVAAPTLVKIDTEGFELDVLEGMPRCLASPALHTLCLEIHFELLRARGLADAPARIERMLEQAGFRCDWPDASHLVATRR